jgi:hypothetical protein
MIDYDKIEKAKEIWKRYEEFDKQWLGTRGVFNIMHKVGMLDDEDHKEVLEHYDRVMAPITKAQDEFKAKVIAKVSKVAWEIATDDDKKE